MRFFLFFCFLSCSIWKMDAAVYGRDTLRCRICFPVGSSVVDLSYGENGSRLDAFVAGIHARQATAVLCRLSLHSGASPEGGLTFNRRLSDKRLASFRSILQERLFLPDSVFTTVSLGEDWEGLTSLVEESDMPCREEVLRILRNTPVWVTRNGVVVDSRKRQLMNLRGGQAWRYMHAHFFPELRNTSVVECEFAPVGMEKELAPPVGATEGQPADTVIVRDTVERVIVFRDTVQLPVPVAGPSKPFYMGLKTNLVYDALLVPNIGVEFALGKGWTLGGNWMYGWWKNDRRHRYWRVYGGEVGLRKYFGQRASDKPLTGHHVGVYGQLLTYDFEFGGRGYMGGRPGGTLWDKAHYGVGFEYGYSLPVARRLNLDFSLGLGYLGGTCYEYVPVDACYVWEKTRTLVTPIEPLQLETSEEELNALFCKSTFKEDYKILNCEIRKLGYNIPPLVNAYMSLSPTMRMFGTAVNYEFGDVEETGILIAVDEILEDKRIRHIQTFIESHPDALRLSSCEGEEVFTPKVVTPQADWSR